MVSAPSVEMNIVCEEEDLMPEYATTGSVAFDLKSKEDISLCKCSATQLVPTGVYVEVPEGYELQIRSRSSLGCKGVSLPHGVGTIDQDYRGELMVPLYVSDACQSDYYEIKRGDRIAQAILAPIVRAEFVHTTVLNETERGCGGFGSTGV